LHWIMWPSVPLSNRDGYPQSSHWFAHFVKKNSMSSKPRLPRTSRQWYYKVFIHSDC
jgi:hypothetical protein